MIGVIDYGIGNIGNVERALDHLHFEHSVIAIPPEDTGFISVLCLPGVGAFQPAMKNLQSSGWSEYLHSWVSEGRPLIGICLGMQLLFSDSTEEGTSPGLGLIQGRVEQLPLRKSPHMGWNTVNWTTHVPEIFTRNIPSGSFYYFVHSFGVRSCDEEMGFTSVEDLRFSSVIWKNNIIGFQFHPERSGTNGLKLLETTLRYFREGHGS